MNKIVRFFTHPQLFMPLFFTSVSLFAQSPFNGTWRTDVNQSKLSPKPFVFSVDKGIYLCSSFTPQIEIKADGTDQPVTNFGMDTFSVREVDSKTIAITGKKGGKTVFEVITSVSDDGNILTDKTTIHPVNSDRTVVHETIYTRIGKAPAGANGTSGSWRMNKEKASDNDLTVTYKGSGIELSMSDPTGASYTARLDGKDYPVKGSDWFDAVSLKRFNERTIEETDKRDGKVVGVSKMTVAPDGKKMTSVYTDTETGTTSTYVAEKQ
jgi:hypothetical protein